MNDGDAPISAGTDGGRNSTTPYPSSTIMIVDDEPTTIDILEMFLQGEGYEDFVTTTDSRQALDLLRQKRPDVLLLDLMMPHVDGLEILTVIRADELLKHTPVIILTSTTDAETKIQALELGATDILAKPVDPSELALRMRNTLAAKDYQDRLTYYDALTGLPNRRFFTERLERTVAQTVDCALVHIGLDRFRQINETLGHKAGDDLLRAVASRLEQCISEVAGSVPGLSDIKDPLVRVGGDEFSLLLPGVDGIDGAAKIAQRILASLGEPFVSNGEDLFVTASIGISLLPAEEADIESFLAKAHIAMSHAKRRGRNEFQFYDSSLNVEFAETLSLENQLRRVTERKELLLHYQPKIDIATGRIIGCEALMRWDHPELGLVAPDRFIPIAEEAGLISQLGAWALRVGCQQNQAWQAAGLPPASIAINVSAKQLQNARFVHTISAALTESGMDPRHLVLELTESMIMTNPTETALMLEAIKAMGVRISIDDFGTGYSSLAYLKRFPIDELKIDRSFIQNLPGEEDDEAIVSAIVLMAHLLGMKVVAEGVETREQLEFLTGLRCNVYQGFLRSKPLPAAEYERLIRGE
jgi:diguanylate cyclase (GGDEF)-like protein